ncbi:CheY-like chemotaxis protein [Deinobacterium chartae]|uniref:CheY-like chemotaxis protein n=1 Tax=Deinobacterium chartae TaxID=521158 RepID=A0A841I0Y3_9DEIO|nr:response regulator [Deinobacterium chartae]MBB6097635.1 CheY-like chemotaxis protein [Deinobacterium chartae]
MHRQFDVLLVEDSPADIFLVEAAFEAAGTSIALHIARDGEEALDFVRNEGAFSAAPRPRLILLDLNLPRINGFQVLEALKSSADTRTIPVVVLTTSRAPEDIQQAYALLASSYVTKPSGLEELVEFARLLEQYWFRTAELPAR